LGQIEHIASTEPGQIQLSIFDAQATFDDEASRVQLVIDIQATAKGNGTTPTILALLFQVTTLARLAG
jgi:hypothetical protein